MENLKLCSYHWIGTD